MAAEVPSVQELDILVGTHFFVYLIICLRTQSCTSDFMHLK